MEKVILNNAEFELVVNGVSESSNTLTVTFLPGASTVEEIMQLWTGNQSIKVVDDAGLTLRVMTNFTKCKSATLIDEYVLSVSYHCPVCGAELVDPSVTTCPACNAVFEFAEMRENRGRVCTVVCTVPDINDRMNDVEESVEDIICSLLV